MAVYHHQKPNSFKPTDFKICLLLPSSNKYLYTLKTNNKMGKTQDKCSKAELCGALIGDGWIHSNERNLFLAGDPKEDKSYYDYRITQLFNNLSIKVNPKHFPYWKVYGISLYSKSKIKKFLDLGVPKGKKSFTAEVPEWIKKSNKYIKSSFIRGLFDTDGGIWCQKDYTKYANNFNSKYHTKIRLRFTSISIQLQKQTLKLLNDLNYKCKLRILKNRDTIKRPNNKDVHIIAMDKLKDIHNFFNKLIPSNEKHLTKYRIWKEYGFCPPYTKIKQRKDILKKKINPYDLYKQE